MRGDAHMVVEVLKANNLEAMREVAFVKSKWNNPIIILCKENME